MLRAVQQDCRWIGLLIVRRQAVVDPGEASSDAGKAFRLNVWYGSLIENGDRRPKCLGGQGGDLGNQEITQ